MRVKLLGSHQGESRDVRFMSILIDDALVIDAGGVTSSLTLEEQDRIEAILVTHKHYDHIKDLPALAHHLWLTRSLQIYCIEDTRQALQKYFFNGDIWPQMKEAVGGYHALTWHDVTPGETFEVLGYKVTPVAMEHTVPTVGYLVERDGWSVYYAADTGSDGNPRWGDIRPDLLIIETTMSSAYDEFAAKFKHLTPLSLEKELHGFHEKQGYYPRTICVHINPRHEQAIRKELSALAVKLGADITCGFEGMVVVA
jgi:ribonuclease BN (tRNA processing enzyme)